MKNRKVQSVIFYCAKNNKKHFLLLQMNKRRKLYWQNVTGGVDKAESFKEAALREAIEETNLTVSNLQDILITDLEFNFIDQWEKDVTEKVFLLHCKEPWEVKLDPNEHCNFNWVSEDNITAKSVHFESNYQALKKAIEYRC